MSVYYPSNTTSAPGSLANLSSSASTRKCVQHGPDSLYCSCSSLFNSLATPSLYSYSEIDSDNGTPVVWSVSYEVSALPPTYTPPDACCTSCNIAAVDVRVLYWPVETGTNGTLSITADSSTPYTLTSNNFEL